MIRILPYLAAAVLTAASAMAQDVEQAARAAASQLEAAQIQLSKADAARDRVAALTATVQAYESGLAAMRDGLRAVATREAQLKRDLEAREEDIAQLVGVLQSMSKGDVPQQMLHPQGPMGAARAGMLVSDLTPELARRAEELRAELEEITTLRTLQENALLTLQEGLSGVQTARTELSQAVADRTDLPKRFSEDPVRLAILIAASETLEGFASGLSEITRDDTGVPAPVLDVPKGELALPVQGTVLRRANQADAAGVVRPGVLIATRPQALVTTPVPATIRYRGPLLNYGLVIILEPQPDLLIVLAGLGQVFGDVGQVLPSGAPVGLMGGDTQVADTSALQSVERAGNQRPETLYIEVREGDATVDPFTWFSIDKG